MSISMLVSLVLRLEYKSNSIYLVYGKAKMFNPRANGMMSGTELNLRLANNISDIQRGF